jgi:hypothetical protein
MIHTPQIIVLAMSGLGLLIAANRHERPRTGKDNFWVSFIATCISLGLLYWGGFFK